ncbi:MAG: hypothetical protein NUV75_09740 [Gallionella sp.]|nr:hypothetical protein [Gallionella sp.]
METSVVSSKPVKHTPGPWSLETVATSAGSCHKIGPFPSLGVYPQTNACVYADSVRVGIDDRGGVCAIADELLANARLIAAAPDGYALAVAVAEHFKDTDAPLGKMARDFIAKVQP